MCVFCFVTTSGSAQGLFLLCSEITFGDSDDLWVPGIESRSTMYKASTLPTVVCLWPHVVFILSIGNQQLSRLIGSDSNRPL